MLLFLTVNIADLILVFSNCQYFLLQVRMDVTQVTEGSELKQRLDQEQELLIAYQSKIRMQMDTQHQRERKELEQRIALRLVVLEQKVCLVTVVYLSLPLSFCLVYTFYYAILKIGPPFQNNN